MNNIGTNSIELGHWSLIGVDCERSEGFIWLEERTNTKNNFSLRSGQESLKSLYLPHLLLIFRSLKSYCEIPENP